MRTAIIMVLLGLVAANAAAAETVKLPSWTHTRPLTPGATALVAAAAERSSVIRTLLADLEQTDVVVYFTDSMLGFENEPRAYLSFLSRAAGTRYLMVRINSLPMLPFDRIALLGHELQHAREVAAAPEVQDSAGLARLYRHIGWEGEWGRFETDQARDIGILVRNQLARNRG
jgi:hypothetical protein